jgi:serine/threonine-protein kinase
LGRAATYGFSPPEQVMGTGTDERSDIYALGATFYALLTGQNPPPAHERVAGTELVPTSQFVADLPSEVEEAIIQSLSLNMNQRQRSVREFALSLGGVEAGLASRPLGIGPVSPGGAAFGNTARSRPSAAVPNRAASSRIGVSQPSSQRNVALALAGIALALAAIATGAYFYFAKPEPQVESQRPAAVDAIPIAKPPVAPTVPKEPPIPVAAPATNLKPPETPATDAAQKQPEQPQPTLPPTVQSPPPPAATPAGTPAGEAGSASKTPQADKPEQEPHAQPKAPTVSVPPFRPSEAKPAAKAHPAAPVERASQPPSSNRPLIREFVRRRLESPQRSSPKPSSAPAPSWTIIPGGAHKTD